MLKRFEVENFQGFANRLVWDLSSRDYSFNRMLVQNGIVNKAIIYGRNGTGKSSLGLALFDITYHLTDNARVNPAYLQHYRNLSAASKPVSFTYVFQFGNDEVIYEYEKDDPDHLRYEKLTMNGETAIDYSFLDPSRRFIRPDLQGSLMVNLADHKRSVIEYLYRNQPSADVPILHEMVSFCDGMLWYRCLSDGNTYAGFTNGRTTLAENLYQSDRLYEFERFLRDNGLNYSFRVESVHGRLELFAVFQDGSIENKVLFESIASPGTLALCQFYSWLMTAFDKVSFLFIDEFDAFLHNESAEYIIDKLNHRSKFQSVVTTHNTHLMTNRLTRPDCCFIMSNNRIRSLKNASHRELREGHNLEKLYISGEFDDQTEDA